MIWKYSKTYALCKCAPSEIQWHQHLFTTLCPMFHPITAEDYKNYHNNIGFVLRKLRPYGFDNWSCSVLLYSHRTISVEFIQKLLPTEKIIIKK